MTPTATLEDLHDSGLVYGDVAHHLVAGEHEQPSIVDAQDPEAGRRDDAVDLVLSTNALVR